MSRRDEPNRIYDTVRVADLRAWGGGASITNCSWAFLRTWEIYTRALVIPLNSIGKVSLAASSRAAKAPQLSLETYSDEKSF